MTHIDDKHKQADALPRGYVLGALALVSWVLFVGIAMLIFNSIF